MTDLSTFNDMDAAAAEAYIQEILNEQRAAFLADPMPSIDQRIDWLKRCLGIISQYKHQLTEAVVSDFGHRSYEEVMMVDLMTSHMILTESVNHLHEWVKDELRRSGSDKDTAYIRYQPLGVVGVISPWNFPTNLTFTPLSGILAAGNRAVIKQSEFTPATSTLMMDILSKEFDRSEVAVMTGGPVVGEVFSRMPWDHLMFTGTAEIAKHVMRGAAENLVPVTLELGGKSPVILAENANIEHAAATLMAAKTMNVGQICVAPDYVFLPEGKVEPFVEAAVDSVNKMFPTMKENDDYSSIINQRHYDRLIGYIEDARQKGGDVIQIKPEGEDFSQQEHHKIPPTIVLQPTDDMDVMKNEVFGPLLPIKTYADIQQTIDYVNAGERPLALYYLGDDQVEEDRLLNSTRSGGVTINDVMSHTGCVDIPFGGIGASGMGCYHGIHGFKNFSHARSIYKKPELNARGESVAPPFADGLRDHLGKLLDK